MNTVSIDTAAPDNCATTIPRPQKIGLVPSLLAKLSTWLLARAAKSSADHVEATSTEDRYRNWRHNELCQQLTDHFDTEQLAGCEVLDFGCGTGELSMIIAEEGARQVTGVDMSTGAIVKASADASDDANGQASVEFFHADDPQEIPVDDNSADIICTFDVLEHIPDIESTCRQWHRVLRTEGRIWIWWSPWRGPYGHHLQSLIPIPWIHLFLPAKTIFFACAAIYDNSAFTPRKWDIDQTSGKKKPNKWHDVSTFEPFLNRLTRSSFEKVLAKENLKILRKEEHGFKGRFSGELSAFLRRIPVLGDCFVSYYIYELGKR